MPRLTYRQRKRLRPSSFVFPLGTKAHPGKPEFPVEDRSHARAALSRAGQGRTRLTRQERCEVVAEVHRRHPDLPRAARGLLARCRIR